MTFTCSSGFQEVLKTKLKGFKKLGFHCITKNIIQSLPWHTSTCALDIVHVCYILTASGFWPTCTAVRSTPNVEKTCWN